MSDWEERTKVLDESKKTLEYLRSTYERTDQKDFFKIAMLRCMAVIIKLLVWIATKG